MVVGLEALAKRGHRGCLEPEIQGGFDGQPVSEDGLSPNGVEEIATDKFTEVVGLSEVFVIGMVSDDGPVGDGFLVLPRFDKSIGQHPAQHVETASFGGVGIAVGRVVAGPLGEAGQ